MVASPVQGHLSPRLDGAGPTKSPGLYPRSRTFRGVRCSSNGWLETAPVYSHGCKLSTSVAEEVAGKPGLFVLLFYDYVTD